MTEDIRNQLEKYEEPTKLRFMTLYELIHESTSQRIEETLWAKLPSFYVDKHFVRLIPFKNHINIEAKAIVSHRDDLSGYTITPKGMLQIYHNQPVPSEAMKAIFKESLE